MLNRLRLNEKSGHQVVPAKGRDYQICNTDVRGVAVCIIASGSPKPFVYGSSQQRLGRYCSPPDKRFPVSLLCALGCSDEGPRATSDRICIAAIIARTALRQQPSFGFGETATKHWPTPTGRLVPGASPPSRRRAVSSRSLRSA